MSTADAVEQLARIVNTAGAARGVAGLLDKQSCLPAEQTITSKELRIIHDRLHHTLDLIPLSTSESHPKLFRVRQDILKQMDVLTSMLLEAAKKDVKLSGQKKD